MWIELFLSGDQGHGRGGCSYLGWEGGGVMQKKESPEFRFPQVNISARERETFEFQAL